MLERTSPFWWVEIDCSSIAYSLSLLILSYTIFRACICSWFWQFQGDDERGHWTLQGQIWNAISATWIKAQRDAWIRELCSFMMCVFISGGWTAQSYPSQKHRRIKSLGFGCYWDDNGNNDRLYWTSCRWCILICNVQQFVKLHLNHSIRSYCIRPYIFLIFIDGSPTYIHRTIANRL